VRANRRWRYEIDAPRKQGIDLGLERSDPLKLNVEIATAPVEQVAKHVELGARDNPVRRCGSNLSWACRFRRHDRSGEES
jgi:hypothetical protein